jgi:hypothetical protein
MIFFFSGLCWVTPSESGIPKQKKHPLSSARWDVLILLGMCHSSSGTQ